MGELMDYAAAGAHRLPQDWMPVIRPMEPKLVHKGPIGPGWLHEIRPANGLRCVVRKCRKQVRFWLADGNDHEVVLPNWQTSEALNEVACENAIFDGEMAPEHHFGWKIFRHGEPVQLERILFYAYDLLWLDGDDLRILGLRDRKARLGELLCGCSRRIEYVEHVEPEDRMRLAAEADAREEDGLISKRATSLYRSGQSDEWLAESRRHQGLVHLISQHIRGAAENIPISNERPPNVTAHP
jgi:bifunctional non-homologous end joining protein LigD